MKNFLTFLLLFSSFPIFSQNNLYFFAGGGFNYIPLKNFSHYLKEFSNSNLDDIGFNGEATVRYNFSSRQNILLSLGTTSKSASADNALWEFNLTGISLGYSYIFSDPSSKKISLETGVAFGYNFIRIDETLFHGSDFFPAFRTNKEYEFSLSPFANLRLPIYDNLNLTGGLKYSFVDSFELYYREINFSGIFFNAGLEIKII